MANSVTGIESIMLQHWLIVVQIASIHQNLPFTRMRCWPPGRFPHVFLRLPFSCVSPFIFLISLKRFMTAKDTVENSNVCAYSSFNAHKGRARVVQVRVVKRRPERHKVKLQHKQIVGATAAAAWGFSPFQLCFNFAHIFVAYFKAQQEALNQFAGTASGRGLFLCRRRVAFSRRHFP